MLSHTTVHAQYRVWQMVWGLCCCHVHVGVFGDPGDVERLLEMGTQSLREGHLSDALLHYHAAIGKHVG